MSVSLSPCSIPGHKPSFTLKDDEMELGLGQYNVCYIYILQFFNCCVVLYVLGVHGEAGTERTTVSTVKVWMFKNMQI